MVHYQTPLIMAEAHLSNPDLPIHDQVVAAILNEEYDEAEKLIQQVQSPHIQNLQRNDLEKAREARELILHGAKIKKLRSVIKEIGNADIVKAIRSLLN